MRNAIFINLKKGFNMIKSIKILTITSTLLTFIFADCQNYYADIDGDGDGAKSVWCSWTELSHATGENWEDSNWETNGCGTVGWNGSTSAGHLSYGPYISSDPGTTNVTWNLLVNGDTDNDATQVATIDIFDATSQELLAWQDINVNDFNASMAWQDFSLSYYSSPDHQYEFRTWYTSDGGHLVLRYITHVNEDADDASAYATTTLCDDDDTSGWSLNDDDLMPLCAGNSNDACWDCAGTWGGSAVEDVCGACNGDGIPDGLYGDINDDNNLNVTDVVLIIGNILNETINDSIICICDITGDGDVNVADIVTLVNIITGVE